MKKIPTLFERRFEDHQVVEIFPKVAEGMEWVLDGEGTATVKWDGACCSVMDGEFYRRYDAKQGKPVPKGAIPCQDAPDPVTGHFPCWLKCDRDERSDVWYWAAYDHTEDKPDGTYEAVGPHFRNNPYYMEQDILIPHGKDIVEVERSFEGIREYLKEHEIEGLVFWKDGEPRCKIKRKDFGYPWGRQQVRG